MATTLSYQHHSLFLSMSDGISQASFAGDAEGILVCTKAYQRLVDEAVTGNLSGPTFLKHLHDTEATPKEAKDYIAQLTHCWKQQWPTVHSNSEAPGLAATTGPSQLEAATAVAWAVLCARLGHLDSSTLENVIAPNTALLSNEITDLLGILVTKGSIPASVLAKAHLSKLSDLTRTGPHLEKTQELLSVYSPQSVQDILVSKVQFALVSDPLPHTVWHKILMDHFVNFEKLFASMDKGYDHHNNPRDFGAGYALVKKDQAFTKHPLHTEVDWTHIFATWSARVPFLFPHQNEELRGYQSIVMNLFQVASSNPAVAISFDIHVCDKYLKKSFHLDDQDQLNFPLLTQMLSLAPYSTC